MQPTPQQTDVHVDNVETVNASSDHAVNDTNTVRIVVVLIGLIVLAIIAATTYLANYDKALPDALIALGGVGLGGLVGLLASTASKRT